MNVRLRAASAAAALALGSCAASLWLYPFEVNDALRAARARAAGFRRAALPGGMRAYERDRCRPGGPCRSVVFVHGMGDSSLTWLSVLTDARLDGDGWRLLAVDMPGTEGSSPPAGGYGIRSQARTLGDALEGGGPWTVVGNSLGGWVALWLALERPEAVSGLVLVNAGGIDDPTGLAERTVRTLADPTPEKMRAFNRLAFHEGRAAPPRAWDGLVAAMRRRPIREVASAMTRAETLDGRLKELRVPVVVVWGESDRVLPADTGRRMSAAIPGAVYRPEPRCGHLPQAECPDAVVRALPGI